MQDSPEQIETEYRELEGVRARLKARDVVLCAEDIRRSNEQSVVFSGAFVAEFNKFNTAAAAAALLADRNIDWPPSIAATSVSAIRLERRALALAVEMIGDKLGALKQRHNEMALERLDGEPRALLHERALLIGRLQGANVRWQAFVDERGRSGGLSGSYLARVLPISGLLGTGAKRQGAAPEYLKLLLKLNIITADEIAHARGEPKESKHEIR